MCHENRLDSKPSTKNVTAFSVADESTEKEEASCASSSIVSSSNVASRWARAWLEPSIQVAWELR